MSLFFLGILAGWVIEWLFYGLYWKPRHAARVTDAGDEGDARDCEQERHALQAKMMDKDREISRLQARLAMPEEAPDRTAREEHAGTSKESDATDAVPRTDIPATKVNGPADINALRKVSGIGPKIAEVLSKAGIDNPAKLAETSAGELESILKASGSRYLLADTSSWPVQARLIVGNDLDGLKKYQQSLRK